MGIKGFNQSGDEFVNKFIRAITSDSTGLDAATPYVAPVPAGHTATGGVISEYTSGPAVYRAHVFTSSGTFVISELGNLESTVEYLVVAGGGGAGSSGTSDRSGGGGAGGFRTNLSGHPLAGSAFPVSASPGSYLVTVGGGGVGAVGHGSVSGGPNQNGNPSYFGPPQLDAITAQAGGGGGSGHGTQPVTKNGAPGGSGGGAGYLGPGGGGSSPLDGSAGTGNTPPSSPSQGNPGGSTSGGGGGGAGGPGASGGPGGSNGAGGAGSPISIETNTAKTYAAGGSGGEYPTNANGAFATGNGGDAVFNSSGKHGGSGIVVVRYKIAEITDNAKATGGAISFYNNKTIHTFTTSGSFVVNGSAIPSAEVVVVAGGGGGGGFAGTGWGASSGGGAGGMLVHPGRPFAASTTYPITIGAGGLGGQGVDLSNALRGEPGSDSTLTDPSSPGNIVGNGGGGGGCQSSTDPSDGRSGGSGGGGAGGGNPPAGAAGGKTQNPDGGATGYGNDGGDGVGGPTYQGGGGGGAGQAGQDSGPGGYGRQLPPSFRDPAQTIGDPGTYGGGSAPTPGGFWVGGGGGCGDPSYPGTRGNGGTGGGGQGTPWPTSNSYNDNVMGKVNTGGGGGGMNASGKSNNYLGNGGSGIILIAYPT